jgi:hypothetical protein
MSERFKFVKMFDSQVSSLFAKKARAEDDVGAAVFDGLEELRIVAWIVLEIGVLNDHHVAVGGGEACAQRRSLSLVLLVLDQPDSGNRPERFARPVGRAVVDDDELRLLSVEGAPHSRDDLGDRLSLVEDRDDNGDLHLRADIDRAARSKGLDAGRRPISDVHDRRRPDPRVNHRRANRSHLHRDLAEVSKWLRCAGCFHDQDLAPSRPREWSCRWADHRQCEDQSGFRRRSSRKRASMLENALSADA